VVAKPPPGRVGEDAVDVYNRYRPRTPDHFLLRHIDQRLALPCADHRLFRHLVYAWKELAESQTETRRSLILLSAARAVYRDLL